MWEVFHLGKEPYRGLNKAQIIEKVSNQTQFNSYGTMYDYEEMISSLTVGYFSG